MFSILQAYATDYGAKIMDDFAKVAGFRTLRGLSETEVISMLPEEQDAKDFYQTLIEACTLPTKRLPKRQERDPYLITYLANNGHHYNVTIWGYSPAQAVGYIRSGKHPVSPYVAEILTVEKKRRPLVLPAGH